MIQENIKECTICHGAGWIYINDINIYKEKIVRRMKCKVCDGKGYID